MVADDPVVVIETDYADSADSLPLYPPDGNDHVAGDDARLLEKHQQVELELDADHTPPQRTTAGKRWNTVRKGLVGLAVLLCGLGLGHLTGSTTVVEVDLARADSSTAVRGPLCNPYNLHGRLNVSADVLSDTRWIPQRHEPGCEVVDYMDRVHKAVKGEGVHESIEFLRGRTVLLVGDSVDRNHVRHICGQLEAELETIGANHELSPAYPEGQEMDPWGHPWQSNALSRPRSCYVRALDLLLVSTFQYGLRDEDEPIRQHCHFYPPADIESRVAGVSDPLLRKLAAKLGRASHTPDLVSLTATFWSIQRTSWALRDGRQAALDAGRSEDEVALLFDQWGGIEDDRAAFIRSRTEEVIRSVASLWPDAPERPRIMWRLLHRTKQWDEIPATRRTAMNEITRDVVEELIGEAHAARAGSSAWREWKAHHPPQEDWAGLRAQLSADEKHLSAESLELDRRLFVNSWADKIDGVEHKKAKGLFLDSIHPGQPLNYLYGNIIFEELRQEILLREYEARREDPLEEREG